MSDSNKKWRFALGVGVISALQLGLEVLFIKLSRYQFASLSLGVIGLALLGVALAGPLTTVMGGPQKAVRRATMWLAPTALIAGAVVFALPHSWPLYGYLLYPFMLVSGLACLVPLALSSVPVFGSIRREAGSVHAYYAASLAGATMGAPLAFALMHFVGDLGAYVGILALCVPAVLLMVDGGGPRAGGVALASVSAIVAAVALPRIDHELHDYEYTRTNAFSRIDVRHDDEGRLHFRTAGINAGTGSAGGTLTDPDPGVMTGLAIRAFASYPRKVLILGSGAGREVVQALNMGAERVIAVEINGMITDYMEEALRVESNPYRDPRVQLVIAEGREHAARLGGGIATAGEGFDLVYVPIATLFGSSGHAFTMTYLMTKEALASYMTLLRPGGRVAVYSPDNFRAKVVVAMAAALEAAGVEDPPAHLTILSDGGRFLVVATPDAPADPGEGVLEGEDRGELPRLEASDELAAGLPLRALTDDNPFLYNDVWAGEGSEGFYGYNLRFVRRAFGLAALLLIFGAGLSVLRTGPVTRIGRTAYLAAFASMGVAYTAFQTVLIQRLAFLVGHPLLATAIVFPCSLLGTAAGAYWSRRLRDDALVRARVLTTVGLMAFIGMLAMVPPDQFVLVAWPSLTRVILAIVLTTPPFLVLGTYFPVIFDRAELEDPAVLATGWLLNGLGAVLGSVLAIYGPMLFGFRTMFLVAAMLYLTLSLWDALSRQRARRIVDLAFVVASCLFLIGTVIILEKAVAPIG